MFMRFRRLDCDKDALGIYDMGVFWQGYLSTVDRKAMLLSLYQDFVRYTTCQKTLSRTFVTLSVHIR